MRIWGTVLLVLGVLFLIMFTLAEFGGGHVGVVPFFVSGFLILMGWNLRNSGKGILQSKPIAEHPGPQISATPNQSVAPAPEFSTVELPLTPEIAQIIARQSARAKRILFYVIGGCLVLFSGIGVVIGATDKTPGEGMIFLAVFASIGVASAGLIYGISWLTSFRLVRRDLARNDLSANDGSRRSCFPGKRRNVAARGPRISNRSAIRRRGVEESRLGTRGLQSARTRDFGRVGSRRAKRLFAAGV